MNSDRSQLAWTPLDVAYLGVCAGVAIAVVCAGFSGLAQLVGSDQWANPILLPVMIWGVSASAVVVGVSLIAAVVQWGTRASR